MAKKMDEFLNEIREMDAQVWKMIERANKLRLLVNRCNLIISKK